MSTLAGANSNEFPVRIKSRIAGRKPCRIRTLRGDAPLGGYDRTWNLLPLFRFHAIKKRTFGFRCEVMLADGNAE